MNNLTTSDTLTSISKERIIGSIQGDPSGPSIIVLAGMHGNEQAGVEAVKELINLIEDSDSPFYGSILGLRGNIKALKQNVRYIDEDINRIWFPSILKQIQHTPASELPSSERREIKQLLEILDEIDMPPEPSTMIVDVHTFSADGDMFTITSKERRQTQLLSQMHVPMIFGIEKTLRGTALAYYQDLGFLSFGLEGGQHENKNTKYNTTASLMLLLEAAGCINEKKLAKIDEFEQHMIANNVQLPAKAELVYQHIIEEDDQFKMRAGYTNFQSVTKGEWLANDKNGKILAQCDGYILMPLYQRQGDDGFFIVKEYKG